VALSVQGKTPTEIATFWNVELAAVRTQMKSVVHKTNTGCFAEIVGRVLGEALASRPPNRRLGRLDVNA
jgi:DNA-binding CsgD family transcriptional regulator